MNTMASNDRASLRDRIGAWLQRRGDAFRRARGVIAAVAAGGAVLSGVVGYWNVYRTVQGPASPATTQAADAGPLSIVVLPFTPLAVGDAAPNDFADGLTASITADLSRIGDAFVVDGGTALAFKRRSLTTQQVARELGVRFVLQGQVQRNGDRIRIRAQLSDGTSNAQLWAETFDGSSGDLFSLQDRVTTLIGNSMGRELVLRAARDSERRHSNRTVADLLLQARALQIRLQSAANWQRVEALARQVLAIDPAHVEGKLLLAKSLAQQCRNFWRDIGLDAGVAKMEDAAALAAALRESRAAEDDPMLHEVLGLVAQLRGDFGGALREFRVRLQQQPKSVEAHVELANAYYLQADAKAAHELLEQALALDPRHPTDDLIANLTWVEYMRGDYRAAIEWGERGLAANPGWFVRFSTLALAYAQNGEHDKATVAASAAFKANPGRTVSEEQRLLDEPLVPVHPAYRTWALQQVIPVMRSAGFPP